MESLLNVTFTTTTNLGDANSSSELMVSLYLSIIRNKSVKLFDTFYLKLCCFLQKTLMLFYKTVMFLFVWCFLLQTVLLFTKNLDAFCIKHWCYLNQICVTFIQHKIQYMIHYHFCDFICCFLRIQHENYLSIIHNKLMITMQNFGFLHKMSCFLL